MEPLFLTAANASSGMSLSMTVTVEAFCVSAAGACMEGVRRAIVKLAERRQDSWEEEDSNSERTHKLGRLRGPEGKRSEEPEARHQEHSRHGVHCAQSNDQEARMYIESLHHADARRDNDRETPVVRRESREASHAGDREISENIHQRTEASRGGNRELVRLHPVPREDHTVERRSLSSSSSRLSRVSEEAGASLRIRTLSAPRSQYFVFCRMRKTLAPVYFEMQNNRKDTKERDPPSLSRSQRSSLKAQGVDGFRTKTISPDLIARLSAGGGKRHVSELDSPRMYHSSLSFVNSEKEPQLERGRKRERR